MASDIGICSTLQLWLSDLLAERGGAQEHVLTALLRLLAKLPAKPGTMLVSGLIPTVQKATQHRSKEVRRLSVEALEVGGALCRAYRT